MTSTTKMNSLWWTPCRWLMGSQNCVLIFSSNPLPASKLRSESAMETGAVVVAIVTGVDDNVFWVAAVAEVANGGGRR